MNAQIYREASEWFVEFRAGDADAATRRAFSEWVRRSPEHVRAYLEIAAIWNEGVALDPGRRYGEELLISLAAVDSDQVVRLSDAARVPRAPEPARRRRATARHFAVAATLLLTVGGLVALLQFNHGVVRAAVGEQRSIALADGSTVHLNSRSRVRVRFTKSERAVDLLEGQAMFQVARDSMRPFLVRSGGVLVRAVGTQFDVYRRKDGTTVTVLEGRVAVELSGSSSLPGRQAGGSSPNSAGAPDRSMLVAAGEQLTVTPGAAAEPTKADVAAATAWTQRRIVFESASLEEVAREFNRYNTRPIVLQDTAFDDFHISGVFSSTESASLIRFLRERPDLRVVETDDEILISRAR